MSYNVSRWQTKVLDNLRIHWDDIPKGMRLTQDSGQIALHLGKDNGIEGHWAGGDIAVDSIDCYGEFSGHDYNDILLPILRHSKGHLEAVLVWEGGDSITRLKADDGVVTEEQVEL